MKTGLELVSQERNEQLEKHGRTIQQDVVQNKEGQLIHAVANLIGFDDGLNVGYTYPDGWNMEYFDKIMEKPIKERLIIAGALICAEIDRLNNT